MVVKAKKLVMKGGSNNGIGKFVRDYIMDVVNKGKELDIKELDSVLFKKFGKGKSEREDGSRVSSIRWYIKDMKDRKMIE